MAKCTAENYSLTVRSPLCNVSDTSQSPGCTQERPCACRLLTIPVEQKSGQVLFVQRYLARSSLGVHTPLALVSIHHNAAVI